MAVLGLFRMIFGHEIERFNELQTFLSIPIISAEAEDT